MERRVHHHHHRHLSLLWQLTKRRCCAIPIPQGGGANAPDFLGPPTCEHTRNNTHQSNFYEVSNAPDLGQIFGIRCWWAICLRWPSCQLCQGWRRLRFHVVYLCVCVSLESCQRILMTWGWDVSRVINDSILMVIWSSYDYLYLGDIG